MPSDLELNLLLRSLTCDACRTTDRIDREGNLFVGLHPRVALVVTNTHIRLGFPLIRQVISNHDATSILRSLGPRVNKDTWSDDFVDMHVAMNVEVHVHKNIAIDVHITLGLQVMFGLLTAYANTSIAFWLGLRRIRVPVIRHF